MNDKHKDLQTKESNLCVYYLWSLKRVCKLYANSFFRPNAKCKLFANLNPWSFDKNAITLRQSSQNEL